MKTMKQDINVQKQTKRRLKRWSKILKLQEELSVRNKVHV